MTKSKDKLAFCVSRTPFFLLADSTLKYSIICSSNIF